MFLKDSSIGAIKKTRNLGSLDLTPHACDATDLQELIKRSLPGLCGQILDPGQMGQK